MRPDGREKKWAQKMTVSKAAKWNKLSF